MDIHRCRFIPYPPSAINALAFSHPSASSRLSKIPTTLRLAVGRANGDIELWNPLKGAWFQESILRGGKDRSVEGLLWTHDPDYVSYDGLKTTGNLRLFSIGYSSAVTEWDLATGRPARHSTGNYGEIWCMAAQPRLGSSRFDNQGGNTTSMDTHNSGYQDIAVGCADGSIVLLSTVDGDLQFRRTLARASKKKARVLSLAFKDQHIVVAGHADSTIRVYDIRNNQLLRSMSLGAGPAGGPKEILVWTVKCASDGTIVSGDSTGTVRFWDGKQYTLIQRITGHVADILDLTISVHGECVFSGGMDRRTTVYRRMDQSEKEIPPRWKQISHQRTHKHDVKAMSSYENKNFSIVVSGGLDTMPMIIPFREYGREHHRSLSNLPQQPCLCSSPRRRLLMTWWGRELNLWKISRVNSESDTVDSSELSAKRQPRRLVSKVELQGEDHLSSADLSVDGSLLAAATTSSIRIFRLRFKNRETLKVRRVEVPLGLANRGARLVQFSPDRRWLLIIRPDSSIEIHRITGDKETKSILLPEKSVRLKRLPRPAAKSDIWHGSLGNYERTICRVAFSSDSRILAVADLSGFIDSWVLEGQEDLAQEAEAAVNGADKSESSDSEDWDADEEQHPTVIYGQHWIRNPAAALIPNLRSAILVLTFRPSYPTPAVTNRNVAIHPTRHNPHPHSHDLPNGEDRLLAITSKQQLYELEILAGRLSDWSRRNPTASFPRKFRENRDRAMGAVWDTDKARQRIWVYGNTWLWMFDLSRDLSPSTAQVQDAQDPVHNGGSPVKKRKRSTGADVANDTSQGARSRDTGAGSRIQDAESEPGIGRKLPEVEGAEAKRTELVDLVPERQSASEDDDDDDDAADYGALVDLRRSNKEELQGNELDAISKGGEQTNGTFDLIPAEDQESPPYWNTYMYRPILGIVPLSDRQSGVEVGKEINSDDADEGGDRLEVALVERPFEDLDLPPRYHGDQEWDEDG